MWYRRLNCPRGRVHNSRKVKAWTWTIQGESIGDVPGDGKAVGRANSRSEVDICG